MALTVAPVAARQGAPAREPEAESTIAIELSGDPPRWSAERAVVPGADLVVWVEADDPSLELRLSIRTSGGEELAAASGGGSAPLPFLRGAPEPERIAFVVEGSRAAAGLRLRVVRPAESDETYALAARFRELQARGEKLSTAEERAGAREALPGALADLERLDAPLSEERIVAAEYLGEYAFELGDVATALAAWRVEDGGLERLRPPDGVEALLGRSNLALALLYSGRSEEAAGRFEELLATKTRLRAPDDPSLLSARQNLGAALASCGRLREALEHFEWVVSERARRSPPDDPALLRATTNLAQARQQLGDAAGARALLERVEEATRGATGQALGERGQALEALGRLLHGIGDLAGARAAWEGALAALRQVLPEEHPFVTGARLGEALTLRALGDLEEAQEIFAAVLDSVQRSEGAESRSALRARFNLATTRLMRGEIEAARVELEEVASIEARTLRPSDPAHLATLQARAIVARDLGRLERSQELTREALEGYRALGNRPELELGLLGNLLELALLREDADETRRLVPQVLDELREACRAARSRSPRAAGELVASSRPQLDLALHALGEGSPELLGELLELVELRRVIASEGELREAWAAEDPQLARALLEAEHARTALAERVASGPAPGASEEQAKAELVDAARARDRAERRVREALSARGWGAASASVEELAAGLGEGQAAVAYVRHSDPRRSESLPRIEPGPDRLCALVLDVRARVALVDLGPAAELADLVQDWRSALGAPLAARGVAPGSPRAGTSSAPGLGVALRARLLDPVLAALGGRVATLHVCADDLVHLVPLDALPAEESSRGAVVGDALRVVVRSSLEELTRPPEPADGPQRLVVVGGVDYRARADEPAPATLLALSAPPVAPPVAPDGRPRGGPGELAPLPGTERELEVVQARFDETRGGEVRALRGAAASKAALATALPGARWVHIATHGWFAPESVRSRADARGGAGAPEAELELEGIVRGFAPMTLCGLALAGASEGRDALGHVPGILTAEELCALDLSRCELAVLSACETNVGIRRAGQGIESLQAALHAAGARTAITSLWRVDDEATRELFERFYSYLWKDGLPKADALWRAKRDLRAAGHPVRDWAGWVLSGDPD